MIRLKTKAEIGILREGGKKLASVLNIVAKKAVPGATTVELEDLACALIEKAGGRPAFKDLPMGNGDIFPTALCTSINDEIVHAPAKPGRVLKSGDIIGIDIGMEYPVRAGVSAERNRPRNKYSPRGGYFTDMAVTVMVGPVDKKAKLLVETTEAALFLGIKTVKPGSTLDDIGRVIQGFVEKRGFSVVRELVGHGVGHKIHEDPQVPHYAIIDNSVKNVVLKSGMVIAIEPMINTGTWKVRLGEDDLTYLTADGGLSAQFEHTVAVTDTGYEILTAL
ncbi:MAG: type I methionyl aminopeptidase [Candidatus Falkowbacteria bacterium]